MAVPGTAQALIAAFSFGILFNAASAALVLYSKGHGSAIYRDGLRLALILFLLSSLSWALVEFLSTLVDPSAASTCQVAVIFSSLFDQFGRVFVEQYLAWAVQKRGDAKTPFSLLPQILVFGRFFVGIAFTAVTRIQFKPTCVPVSSIRAVSVVAVALDAVIIGLFLVHAFSNSLVTKNPGSQPRALGARSIRLTVVGVAIWWGTSVASLLGFESTDLFYRTALPGIGLTVLVGLVSILSQTLTMPRELPLRPDSPVSREVRDLSSSDSADYPPSRYEDLKGVNSISVSALATKTEVSRTIRRNDDGTFPAISRPVMALSGMNGNLTQEQFSSTLKPSNFAPALPTGPPFPENEKTNNMQKGTEDRVNIIAKPKTRMGKMAISNPILSRDESMQNPLNKISTIDLAEAASNERIRREKHAQRISTLVAQRPAPRPPSFPMAPSMVMNPQTALELERSASSKTNKTSSGLSVEGNASSTGTQLSPGVDAIRRRSPRQPEPATLAAPFKVIRPGEPIRIPIPRPPERDQAPQPTKLEPVKTPLQRRPTTGLPSNPRAQTLKSLTKESGNQEPQTVMFINNIVYDNPNTVGDIIQGVTKVPQPPDSGESVVNRPRPIPRKGDKGRQVFPAEISPTHHRRSKSGGSLVSRKSILQLLPGSPTGLPSLPPMPQMTGSITRAVPNDTKSMTIEEKMRLLYTVPLSAPSSTESDASRHPPVPELSPTPAIVRDVQLQPLVYRSFDLESNIDTKLSRASKRTTVRTSSILGIRTSSPRADETYSLAESVNARNPADEVGNSWLPGIPFKTDGGGRLMSGEVKRRSSPVLPMTRQLSMSTVRSEARSGDEETITNWGSVHSPAVPVSRQNARSTYIQKDSRHLATCEGVPSLMFDMSIDSRRPSSEGEGSPSSTSDIDQGISGQFHRRVGDECPTFSTRKHKKRLRKMPPPAPLLLNGWGTKRAIVVQTAEPSPKESPGAAYEVIQAQLRNFEQPDRDSVQSPGRRLALLANLEREMGQFETKWQSTHDHLGRDSTSSIQTSPSRYSLPSSIALQSSRPFSQRSSVVSTIAERRASRRARIQLGWAEGSPTLPSQNLSTNAENTGPAFWQTGLVEAQVKISEYAPELLLRRNNFNFLSVSKAGLGSPSPPETDESDSDVDSRAEEIRNSSSFDVEQQTAPIRGLWMQRAVVQQVSSSWLWNPLPRMVKEHDQSYELPGLSIRPAARKIMGVLTIESSRLWQSNSKMVSTRVTWGLWNNESFSGQLGSAQATVRPITMRPPRKYKRMTLLPDIIENPEFLPDKRGTLGIFQFPWGERSENATLQYRPSQAMSGTMTTGRPVVYQPVAVGVRQSETTDYSSSFFDEYDEEEGDNFSDFSGSGDDDFDETTLWEIASLLRTDQIPSKNSLLFMSSQSSPSIDTSVLAEYVIDIPSEDEHEDDNMASVPDALEHKVAGEGKKLSIDVTQPQLWTPRYASQDHLQNFGLPQQESLYWSEYTSEPANRIRAQRRAGDLEIFRSTRLWSPVAKEKANPELGLLWAASKDISKPQVATYSTTQPAQTQLPVPGLWTNSGVIMGSVTRRRPSTFCLPEPDSQIWQKLVSQMTLVTRSKPRIDRILPIISSTLLWSASNASSAVSFNENIPTPRTVQASHNAVNEPAMLWTQPAPSRTHGYNGLYKSGPPRIEYRTTAETPAALSVLKRSHRHVNTPPQPLASNTLWNSKGLPCIKPSMADLWKPNANSSRVATSRPMPTSTATDNLSGGLWKRPRQEARNLEFSGLLGSKAAGYDIHGISKSPAIISSFAKPRLIRGPQPTLTSNSLWTPQPSQLGVVGYEHGAFLGPEKPPSDIRRPALFISGPRGTDHRTITADLVAVTMIRKARTMKQPLQDIQSTRLWIKCQVRQVEMNWITTCTSHPTTSLAPFQAPASPPSASPSTEAVLVRTSDTTVSNNTTPRKGKVGFFSNWFSKKMNTDPTATVPADQAQLNAIIPDHRLSVLADAPHVKPAHTVLRDQYPSTVTYSADRDAALAKVITASCPGTMLALRASYPRDWDGQLRDAITASHIVPKLTRKRATPRDWSVALHSAIVESYPELRYPRKQALTCLWNTGLHDETPNEQALRLDHDVAVRHPVFMGSLETSAETVHPALTGYRAGALESQLVFAAKHPVSFGSSSTSSYDTMHPAMPRSGSQRQGPCRMASASPSTISLWSKSSDPLPVTLLVGLWTPGSETASEADSASRCVNKEDATIWSPRKGNKTYRPAASERVGLGKQGLWKRGNGVGQLRHPSSLQRNWLEDSLHKRFTGIELRY